MFVKYYYIKKSIKCRDESQLSLIYRKDLKNNFNVLF